MNLISGKRYLRDTNVLVYAVNRAALRHERVKELLEGGLRDGVRFTVAHQNLLELIAVLVRSFGIAPSHAQRDAEAFAGQFEVIAPFTGTLETFARLMKHAPKSAYPFDVYLAATMLDNNVRRIITGNVKDFQRFGFEEIVAV